MKIKTGFLKHLDEILPLNAKRMLVAVSGGVDSMVLLDLLQNTSLSLSVAHANFQLRAIESDADEQFVGAFCSDRKIPFYVQRFDTLTYVEKNSCSIQMAARDLRYKWFSHLLKELKLDCIILGHHLNDALETFLINSMRGTGLKGLLGISNTECILRPLLPFTREQIIQYAQTRKLCWREDSSNQDPKYVRNFVRHHITPLLSHVSTNLYKNFSTTLLHLNGDYILSEQIIQKTLKEVTLSEKKNPFQWEFDVSKLKKLRPLRSYLFRFFSSFGFKNLNDLEHLLHAQSGKQLFSPSYRIVKDRSCWLLSEKEQSKKTTYEIDVPKTIAAPLALSFALGGFVDKTALVSIDFEKINLPLLLRNWRSGDYFYPLGMQQKKKISKFFKDEKFSLLKKEQTWLLVNADGAIIWIVGYRMDDRFKIRPTTRNVLNISKCS